eukprot:4284487-Prymnesium_polylepis.1
MPWPPAAAAPPPTPSPPYTRIALVPGWPREPRPIGARRRRTRCPGSSRSEPTWTVTEAQWHRPASRCPSSRSRQQPA